MNQKLRFGTGREIMENVDFGELKKFIAESRRNTYAGEGKRVETPLLSDSRQLEYKNGKYFYRDIYFDGEDNFAGQEVIYIGDRPVWAMVYCGSAEPDEMTGFLKKSLTQLSEKCRFGGVAEFQEGKFRYKDNGNGSMQRFDGQEMMFIKEKDVYKLIYSGGLIFK